MIQEIINKVVQIMSKVILREIKECTSEQKYSVRDLRNKLNIRKAMYTDHEVAVEEHIEWMKKIETDDKQIVFVVLVEEVVSGVVSVNEIDRLHKKSDWAFYLDEKVRGGLGAALEFTFINFVFEELQLEKLNCEVIETNIAVVKLHKKFGFVVEGFRRDNILKGGRRIGVFFMGLTKADWNNCRAGLQQKYAKTLEKFDIKMEY